MQLTTEDVLSTVGEQLVADVRASQQSKGLRASGRSAASTRALITSNQTIKRLQIVGLAYWRFQQNGRGPGKSKYPSRAMVDAIKQWVKDKGLDIPPYAIAMKIQRDGIRVPNAYNPGGVLSEPLNIERVRGLLKVGLRPIMVQKVRSLLF